MIDFQQLRDLRPQRARPRQPLRPGLALRGARDLALGRLPARARRRRGAGARLLPRRRLRRWSARSTASSCCWRRRETAILAGLAAVAARSTSPPALGGTPYTAAKAIEIAAPLVGAGDPAAAARSGEPACDASLYLRARRRAAVCSLLALANAPGRPDLLLAGADRLRAAGRRRLDPGARLRPRCSTRNTASATSPGSCAAAASASAARAESGASAPPAGVRFVDHRGRRPRRRPFAGLRLRRDAAPYVALGDARSARPAARAPCPLIAVRQAAKGPRAVRMAAHGGRDREDHRHLPDGKPLELPGGRDRRRRRGGDRAGAGQGGAGDPGRRRAARPRGAAARRRRRDRDPHRPRPRGAGADPPRRRPRDGRGGAWSSTRGPR